MMDTSSGTADSRARATRLWIVAGAALVLFTLAATVQGIWSSDFWWQLKNGEWIAEHRAVPTADEFSHTARGRPLREMRWLYCLAIHAGWSLGGPALLVAAQAGAIVAGWAMIVWPFRRVLVSPAGLAIVFLGVAAGFGRYVMRPELVTFTMTAVFLCGLDAVRAGRARRAGWLLPAGQVAWVNGHTLFLFGPFLAWAVALGEIASAWLRRVRGQGGSSDAGLIGGPRKRLLVIAALVTAACWVNPYGHAGAMYAVQVWRESSADHVVARSVGELHSPLSIPAGQWPASLWALLVLLLGAGATFVVNRARFDLVRLGVFAAGAYLGVMAQRNAALSALMVAWAALGNVEGARAAGVCVWGDGRFRVFAHAALAGVFGFAAWFVASDRYAVRADLPRESGLGVVSWIQPRDGAEFLAGSGAPPNLFNNMRDGGYLAWRVGDRLPVFLDGRTDVYGPQFLAEFEAIAPGNWGALADKWSIHTAVLPVSGFEDLVGHLRGPGGWALVHLDHRNVVFVRRSEANAAFIARHEIDPTRPWEPAGGIGALPDERPPAWKRVIGGVGRPWCSLGLADTFLALGSPENAAVYARLAHQRFPGHERAAATFAGLSLALGAVGDSDRVYRTLSARWREFGDRLAARLLLERARLSEAITPLRRVVEAVPSDRATRIVLADTHFRLEEFDAARREYARALENAPAGVGGASEWMKLGFACERTNDAPAAAAAYRRSLELDGAQPALWNQLGMLLARSGDRVGAARCFESALRIKPDYEAARRNLAAVRPPP